MKLPVVAIVGRPNVGKSSLLNAIAGRLISIVQDMPGVTRDRISTPVQVNGRFIELVDTGGFGFEDSQGLTEHIREQILIAMTRAELVLFIVDCQSGLTSADEQIAAMLREKGVRTVLVANKADAEKADVALGDFARLGFGTPIGVSATTRRNLDNLLGKIADNVDLSNAPTEIPEPEMRVAIVGKRNAGKSTFVNAVARLFEDDEQRVIVSEVPGTTRDSVDVRFEKDGKALVVIDTAGVRKKKRVVASDLEFYSFHRAQRSIRRADVVLLLIDATEPVSEPDKKLAGYIAEQYKPVVLVVNKWDLARRMLVEQRPQGSKVTDAELMEEYRTYLDLELAGLTYAPIAFVTAKDGRNIPAVIDLTRHMFKQANERVGTGRLNAAMQQVLNERPVSASRGRRARIYYATQVDVAPPTIVLFVNDPELIDVGYQRFIVNRFRELLPYSEVPIKLLVRPRTSKDVTGEPTASSGRPNPTRRSVSSRKSRRK
jgi:GTP-binding protein